MLILGLAAVCALLLASPALGAGLTQTRDEMKAAQQRLGQLQGELDNLAAEYTRPRSACTRSTQP
jgi:hypothetical protein